MKKLFLVNILVCLLIGGKAQAVRYTPYRGAQRISCSSSVVAAPTTTVFRSTSVFQTPVGYTSSVSLTANGIARAPQSGLRSSLGGGRGLDRDDDDEATGSIGKEIPVIGGTGLGNNGFQKDSPIGDINLLMMLILTGIYLFFVQKRIKNTK